jgi:hypothetical protein
MLFSSSDIIISSVNGANIVLAIKRCLAAPVGVLGL